MTQHGHVDVDNKWQRRAHCERRLVSEAQSKVVAPKGVQGRQHRNSHMRQRPIGEGEGATKVHTNCRCTVTVGGGIAASQQDLEWSGYQLHSIGESNFRNQEFFLIIL